MTVNLKVKKNIIGKKSALKMEKLALANILEDIQEDRVEVDNQRKAILNILEDVNEAQGELKQRYKELETISSLTHSLGLSMELTTVMQSAGEAINSIIPESIAVFCIAPLEHDELTNKINIYSVKSISDNQLRVIEKNILQELKKACYASKCKQKYKKLEIEFLFTNDKKSSDQKPIIDQLVIPLNILSKTVGLMVLFFKVKPKFKKHQSSPVNTIIENVIQTIERLRILVSSEYSRFSNLINSMSNGVIMFDLNNKILLANPVAEQIANSKQEDLTLDNFLGLIHKVKKTFTDEIGIRAEKEEIDMKKVIDAVIRNNEPVVFQEVTINDRTFEVSITPTRDFKREIAGGAILLHDITHLKEISELKTEFVSLASHQLRTPLTSIRLFTEMLLDEAVGPINSDQKEYINNMYKSTINMIELVNNLLNLSRIESGKLKINYEPVDLEGFMVDLIKEAMVLAEEKKCKLEFIKPKKKFEKQIIDSNLLRQVVHNLITNAIRYSEDGKGVIIVTLAKKDDSILIDVTDNGIGIPQSIQTRIFDKFFRADNAVKAVTEGSGLGLYIAKIIMQGFNGKIWFDSKDGQHGTTFHVKFPCKLV